MYRRRWEIETMFGCLKTRGFRMEDTHITDPDKSEKGVFVFYVLRTMELRNMNLFFAQYREVFYNKKYN